mmetsp:Transcript_8175/g.18277  ORF Transcript_8175/g.18277 Transcript_8175/m.18277 type:complete len:325 (+) Transcript_8175:98-1072(+)
MQAGAIVTGGASGIGLASAEALVKLHNIAVVIADRDSEHGELEAKRLSGIAGTADQSNKAQFIWVDVSDEDAIKSMLQQASDWFISQGVQFRYVVNSAGCDFMHPFGDPRVDAVPFFDRAMAVNLRSVYLVCHHSVPLLEAAAVAAKAASGLKHGKAHAQHTASILNVSSIQATRCYHDYTVYAATKGGINSMTINLSCTLAKKGIRVNSLCPGAVKTHIMENSRIFEPEYSMWTEDDVDTLAQEEKTSELMNCQEPAVIGEAAAGLLLMRGVTGQCLVVDGGCSSLGYSYPDRHGCTKNEGSESAKLSTCTSSGSCASTTDLP